MNSLFNFYEAYAINFMLWTADTADTPYKDGVCGATFGWAIGYTMPSDYACIMAMGAGDPALYVRCLNGGVWTAWSKK